MASYAAQALAAFSSSPQYAERILKLRTAVLGDEKLHAPVVKKEQERLLIDREGTRVEKVLVADPVSPRRAIAVDLSKLLFEQDPKKYAPDMLLVIKARLASSEMSLGDDTPAQLVRVIPNVKREQLYPLVPLLIGNLDAFFSEARKNAHLCLILITGEMYPFNADWETEKRRGTVKRYRDFYDKNLANK